MTLQKIKNPLKIAEQTADLIFKHSYLGIEDILLFGSSLKQEESNDIDMLIIHQYSSRLDEFGELTSYDASKGERVIDMNKKFEDIKSYANPILSALGSNKSSDPHDELMASQMVAQRYFRDSGGRLDEREMYLGDITIDGISIKGSTGPNDFWDKYDKAVKVAVGMDETAVVMVENLFKQNDLTLNPYLDLHAMYKLVLMGEFLERKELAIKQCRDPTFWHSILDSGRLYNKETSKFEIPIEQKYPGCLKLFQKN